MTHAEFNAILLEENKTLKAQVEALEHQIEWFKRHVFGRKSEKQLEENPFQLPLFESEAQAVTPAPETTEVKSHRRKSNTQRTGDEVNDSGLRFDDSIPKKVIEVSAPELRGQDADQYEIIDYKDTARLAQQPGSYFVLVYRRPVLRHKAQQTVKSTPAPENVLEGCYADVSVLAGIMVDKAVYHLPLYRQHQRMLASGVQVSRTTLTNWIKKGIELLRPIYRAQWEAILESSVLAMDETPIKAGRKAKGKMKQTYYWPIYGENDEIVFTWSASRGHRHAVEQLSGFRGALLTDGYAAYDKAIKQLNRKEQTVIHANCWVHARRTFEKALKLEPVAAKQALAKIGALFKLEQQAKENNYPPDKLLEYRQKYSEPIINEFFSWVFQQRQRADLLPSNPLSKALNYVYSREAELKVFLANPSVPLDTNHLERSLRVIPMGRKNYLFCWSELGAEHLGILQSLMVTCRIQGINPYHYLVDVLLRVGVHPASKVDELIPRRWKEKYSDNRFVSDLAMPEV